MTVELYHPGLRGVIVGETEISRLDGGLQYRGYCLHDLVEQASFLEVAYLLLFDDLPSIERLADFRSILIEEAELPPQVLALYEQLPLHGSPMEALRTGISLLSHFDPQSSDEIDHAAPAQATRILARAPLLLASWHRLRRGKPVLAIDPDLGFSSNLLRLLTGRAPGVLHERALEVALIVSAEQEFNSSTYAARVVASNKSDLYSAVLAGLGTLMGRANGGMKERVSQVLRDVESPEDAETWLERQPEQTLPPGFGHPVFSECDPRAAILETVCGELATARGDVSLEEKADAIERAVWDARRVPPNLDWPLVRLFHYLGVPSDLHGPLFACGRIVGWCAHAMEQLRDADPIRPRARYRGAEDLDFVALHDRG